MAGMGAPWAGRTGEACSSETLHEDTWGRFPASALSFGRLTGGLLLLWKRDKNIRSDPLCTGKCYPNRWLATAHTELAGVSKHTPKCFLIRIFINKIKIKAFALLLYACWKASVFRQSRLNTGIFPAALSALS